MERDPHQFICVSICVCSWALFGTILTAFVYKHGGGGKKQARMMVSSISNACF